MTPPLTGLLVDLLGFLTGIVLYAMLVVMVWREHSADREARPIRRGLLPLATGCCGLVWNVGALMAFGPRVATSAAPAPALIAVAFSALGFLPAVVVHSLLEGRETAVRRGFIRPAIGLAYALSTAAALLHLLSALRGLPVPSRPALWLSTVGFGAVAVALLLATRRQPIGRRGVWVVALSLFAVSALHFGRHTGTEAWWLELIGHQASLPLALAILHQDYRFAFADLFLKNAIALLLLMGISLTVFSAGVVPLLRWQGPDGRADPRAVGAIVILWMATALLLPAARRLADRVVDRTVLRRADYHATVGELTDAIESLDSEEAVVEATVASARRALGVTEASTVADPLPTDQRTAVVRGSELRGKGIDAAGGLLLRLRTVDGPQLAILFGHLGAGRRLLSDDERLLEAMGRIAARRIDGLRVTQERVARDLREQQMQRLASEAELRALRAQLNPHFLFNALTTIGFLIQQAPPRALETLLRLTSVLRGVLRRSATEFSSLGEEIDLIGDYLEIEQARFEERVRITIDVPSDIRSLMIPTLLLQPLVENAIKHGLTTTRAGGLVRIAAAAKDGVLTVVVEDSGAGFDPQSAVGLGLGLHSVAERLRVLYGTRSELNIRSVPGMGATVTVRMPAAPVVDEFRRKAL